MTSRGIQNVVGVAKELCEFKLCLKQDAEVVVAECL